MSFEPISLRLYCENSANALLSKKNIKIATPMPPSKVIQNWNSPEASSLRDLTIKKLSANNKLVHTPMTGPGDDIALIIERIAMCSNRNQDPILSL